MHIKNVLRGLVIGSSISAMLTLLFTPKSGKELREDMKKNGENLHQYYDTAVSQGKQLKTQVSQTTKISKSAVQTFSKEVSSSIHEWKKETDPSIAQLKHHIEDLQKSVATTQSTLAKKK